MTVQWFPGHMHLTKKTIEERIKHIDVVIEMVDARLPGSSANPMLAALTSKRPSLKVLNKQDLADPVRTALWLAHYNAREGTRAIALDTTDGNAARRLIAPCRELAPTRGESLARPLRVMICGIPNVGKSTLINRLVGKSAAKAADEAGVTRNEQRIVLEDAFHLYDTPGMLWPRIIVAQSGYNLAASGAVGRNAFDDQEVALELLDYLKPSYPALLAARYSLKGWEALQSEELLEAIGRSRGALMAGNQVNLQKAAELLIHDFRSGALGRITLETPEEYARWLAEGRKLDAERQLRKDELRREGHIRAKPAAKSPAARKTASRTKRPTR
ncbi:MAG: ribosome biogenesis GTPase YlqF [Hylemonella sp.]|uniref:ribosome biogenesis GTPase YlqF n=1 Tax=Hylemonella sp. TaxID=2066020 RepID=UPI0022BB1A3C|nr:ribosome biogenesis GTPase YlqF [Hylemonella sp.]MCZ8252202.1 ribosome biogenesis GTPase YlqF [Hylemonella sp.]